MDLIRENKQKKRAVFKDGNFYKKIWYIKDVKWLTDHIKLLDKYMPGYVHAYGFEKDSMWIKFNTIPGIPASKCDHTPEFVKQVYHFCLDNINQTAPYAHGDWVLSNILVDGANMQMCDWDNLNLWPKDAIKKKLHNDLKSAFGDKFDPTSI